MRCEKRLLLENGDVYARTEDSQYFKAEQKRNGLTPFQLVEESLLPVIVKEVFHVEQKEGTT